MFRNYITTALRNLLRNKFYAAINIVGLALGFGTAIFIALYVRDEATFDRFWPDHERIYRVMETVRLPDQAPLTTLSTFPHIAAALKAEFPEVETTARATGFGGSLRHGDVETRLGFGYWVDPDFFDLFPMQVVAGHLDDAVRRPDGIVLTRTLARSLFGREDIIGETVDLNRQYVLHVTAVVEDLPSNTNQRAAAFLTGVASFSRLSMMDAMSWDAAGENSNTFVRLKPGARIADINQRMPQFAKTYLPGAIRGVALAQIFNFSLIPIGDIHTLVVKMADSGMSFTDPATLRAMAAIAVLILALAGSNFVGMMTARAARRAVEVGVRKAVGGARPQIVAQFLGEGMIYAILAVIVAIAAVVLAMPGFDAFLKRSIVFDLARAPLFGLGIPAIALLVGLAAGAYPALVMSAFRPSAVLKGAIPAGAGSSRLRQALVVFQFAALIALIAGTVTIYRQAQFAIYDRLRAPEDQIVIRTFAGQCAMAFADAASRLSGVRAAACISGSALSIGHNGTIFSTADGRDVIFKVAEVDYGFFESLGIRPVAGRLFAADRGEDNLLHADPHSTDNPSVILNETGARALGFAAPGDAVGRSQRWTRLINQGKVQDARTAASQIVGVVPDLALGSVKDAVEPTAYVIDPGWFDAIVIRLTGAAIPETMTALGDLWTAQGHAGSGPFGGRFFSSQMNGIYSEITQQSELFLVFAGIALLIACLGLLGLAAFIAESRTKEIGIRKAMGASRVDVLRLLLWQFAKPVLWANLIAWPVAGYLMNRWLHGFAYHVDLDPLIFVGASTAALVIALATVAGHALLVARAKPVAALRYE